MAQVPVHSVLQNWAHQVSANLRDKWALSHFIDEKTKAQEEEAFGARSPMEHEGKP